MELNNHGKCILDRFDTDIATGKVHLYSDKEWIKEHTKGINVKEKLLELYALL